jgi:hypothetical protein
VGAVGGVVGEIWVREGRGSKRDPDLSPPSGCDPVICPPSTGNPGPDRPAGRPRVTLTCARRPGVTLISARRPGVTLLSSGRRAASGERPLEHTSTTLLQRACKLHIATRGTQTSTQSLHLGLSLHHRSRWRGPS